MSVFSSSLAPFLVSFVHILRYLIAVLQNNFQLALIRAKRFSRQCPLRVFYFYAVHYYSSYSLTVTIVSVFNRARFVAVLLFLKCQVFVYRNLFLFAFLSSKTLFTWSGGPRSSGVSFFCFVSPTPTNPTRPGSSTPCKEAHSFSLLFCTTTLRRSLISNISSFI